MSTPSWNRTYDPAPHHSRIPAIDIPILTGHYALVGQSRDRVRFVATCLILAIAFAGCSSDKSARENDDISGVTIVTALASDGPRVVLAERFIDALNRGDRATVRVLFADDPSVSDCDYTSTKVVEFRGRDQVSGWIDGRIADHDHLTVERIENGNDDPSSAAIGVTFARRSSDSLRALGFADGVRPPQGSAKIRFVGSGTSLRIEAFANGPGGGSPTLCKPA